MAYSLLKTESDFLKKLPHCEKTIYCAEPKKLLASGIMHHDGCLVQFAKISALLQQLDYVHGRYNDLNDLNDSLCRNSWTTFDLLAAGIASTMQLTLAIGDTATVVSLENMDLTDTVYRFLADIKMQLFDLASDSLEYLGTLSTVCEEVAGSVDVIDLFD